MYKNEKDNTLGITIQMIRSLHQFHASFCKIMKTVRDHMIHNINQQKGVGFLYLSQDDVSPQIMQQGDNVVIGGQVFGDLVVREAGSKKKQQYKGVQDDVSDIVGLIYDNTLLGLTVLEPLIVKGGSVMNASLVSAQIVSSMSSKQLEFCGYQLYCCQDDTVLSSTGQPLKLSPLSHRGVHYGEFEYNKCTSGEIIPIEEKINEMVVNEGIYAVILVIKVIVKQKNVTNKNEIYIECLMPIVRETQEVVENIKAQLHAKMTNSAKDTHTGNFNFKYNDKEFINNVLFDIQHNIIRKYDQQGTLERLNESVSADELFNMKHIIFSTTFQHIFCNSFLNSSQLIIGALHVSTSLQCNNLIGFFTLELLSTSVKQVSISNKDVNFLQTRAYQLVSCLNAVNSLEQGNDVVLQDKELQTDLIKEEEKPQQQPQKNENTSQYDIIAKNAKESVPQEQPEQRIEENIAEEPQIVQNDVQNEKLQELQNEVQIIQQSSAQNVEQIIAQHYQMINQERTNNMKMQLQMLNEQIYNYKQYLLNNSTKQQQYNLDIEAQNIKQQTQLVDEQMQLMQQQLTYQQGRYQHLQDKFEMFFQKNSQIQEQLHKFKLSLKKGK